MSAAVARSSCNLGSMRRALAVGLAGGGIILIALGASCRDTTEVFIEARTDLAYRDGLVTTFTVGAPGETEQLAPTTESRVPWGADGFVGSLAVVPDSGPNGRLAVKVVLGIDRASSACKAPLYAGCIVARRTLGYVPHERLRLPISLYALCKDVPCDAASTCNMLGQCVTAAVDPATCASAVGCTTPGDPNVAVTADASSDAPAPDASASDAANDGAANDGAAIDATLDANDAAARDASSTPPTPGRVDCKSGSCDLSAGETCCFSQSMGTGNCLPAGATCPAGTGLAITCDGDEDCNGGRKCCFIGTAGSQCGGTGAGGCNTYPPMCHSTNTCSPGTGTCTGTGLGYYRICAP